MSRKKKVSFFLIFPNISQCEWNNFARTGWIAHMCQWETNINLNIHLFNILFFLASVFHFLFWLFHWFPLCVSIINFSCVKANLSHDNWHLPHTAGWLYHSRKYLTSPTMLYVYKRPFSTRSWVQKGLCAVVGEWWANFQPSMFFPQTKCF